jgi:hypothetical protein
MNARVDLFSTADGRDAVGPTVLAGLRERLAGAAALIVNGERGFARIGAQLAQHVDAEAPLVLNGGPTTRITSRILVLQDVRGDADEIDRVLTHCNAFAESYRYVYDAAAGTVTSHQSAIVHEGVLDWWTPLLATAFALQLQRADEYAVRQQEHVGGRIAAVGSPHILKFRRHQRPPRPRLATGPKAAERQANRFARREEFEDIARTVPSHGAVVMKVEDAGIWFGGRFDRSAASIHVRADASHPRSGEGLAVFLKLPVYGRFEELSRLAAWLNRREASGELIVQGIGAWSVVEDGERSFLRHALFVPKDAWAPGLAQRLAVAMMAKLGRVDLLLNGDRPPPKRAVPCKGARPL